MGPLCPIIWYQLRTTLFPLPKFQKAPRLKILMSSGSKKRTQIYHPFLSKSPGKRIPSRFASRAPMERDTCLQGIFTYLLISKALRKGCPSIFPKSLAPMETDAHTHLTPCSRGLLQMLIAFQPLKKFHAFYGTWRFITTFTRACHLFPSWAILIHSMPPPIPLLKDPF